MDTSMIGKIEKAKRYAQEPQRVTLNSLAIEFTGDNSTYNLSLGPDGWHCTCPGFQTYGICPHIMALEKVLGKMLKRDPLPYAPGQNIVSDVKKAHRYSEELDRLHIRTFDASFQGGHADHQITYEQGNWGCSCSFFQRRNICTHTMTLERILKNTVMPITNAVGD
jgi:hypothetical protein